MNKLFGYCKEFIGNVLKTLLFLPFALIDGVFNRSMSDPTTFPEGFLEGTARGGLKDEPEPFSF